MHITGELKWHIDKEYAHLKFCEEDHEIHIDTIFVPAIHRKRGIGSTLLQRILAMADQIGKRVLLDARPIGATGEEHLQRLIVFYQRFGFKVTSRGNCRATMIRQPRR